MSATNGGDGRDFAFTAENAEKAKAIVACYPEGRQASAVLALLDLAQRQNGGWLPLAALDHVADHLRMPRIRVYEVATFYSMFNLEPVGRHLVQVCTTTPCWLCGSDDVLAGCRDALGIEVGETSAAGAPLSVVRPVAGSELRRPVCEPGFGVSPRLSASSTRLVLAASRSS